MKSVALYLLSFFIFAFAGEIVTWEKQYDSGYYDSGEKIISLKDGNFLVGGKKNTELSNSIIWFLKINADGDTLWTKTEGMPSYDTDVYLDDIGENLNSDIYFGYTIAPTAGVRGHLSLNDSAFNDLWDVTFPAYGMMASSTNAVECIPDSGCIVSWTEQGSIESGSGHLGRYDKDGNQLHHLSLSNMINDSIYSYSNDIMDIEVVYNDGIKDSLFLDSTFVVIGNRYTIENNYPYIMQLDNELNIFLQADLGIVDYSFLSIEHTQDNNYIILSEEKIMKIEPSFRYILWSLDFPRRLFSMKKSIDGNYFVGASSNTYKIDIDGNILWTKDYGSYDLMPTSDGGCLAVGVKNSNIWIYKMDENGDYTSIDSDQSGVIDNYSLQQNYPNPFNNATIIPYKLYENSDIEINIYNAKGEMVLEVSLGKQNKGAYNYQLNANKLTAGVYYYSLLINGKTVDNKKMLYLK